MMIKDIYQRVLDEYNYKGGENFEFSLPFITEYNGKDYVTIFEYSADFSLEDKGILMITDINHMFIVDYQTGDINKGEVSNDDLVFPQQIEFSEELEVEDYDNLMNNYFKQLDHYFQNGDISEKSLNKCVDKMISKTFKQIYLALNAKYFAL